MVNKAKFEPIGDVLSPGVAFVQTASALDVAATIAQRQDDIPALLKVAQLYMELSERMMTCLEEDEEEVDEEALAKKQPLGFSPQVDDIIVPELEEELVDE